MPSIKPRYDPDRRRLLLGKQLVKQFRTPATNQIRILEAFQEEGWPRRIDDPLPPTPEIVIKRRLHDTIKRLNANQHEPLLRFHGDGTGEGLWWELNRVDPET